MQSARELVQCVYVWCGIKKSCGTVIIPRFPSNFLENTGVGGLLAKCIFCNYNGAFRICEVFCRTAQGGRLSGILS